MDEKLELKIIELTKDNVLKYGSSSIKQDAENLGYAISLSEQKKLAQLLVKSNPFVTELSGKEILVKQNKMYSGAKDDTNESYKVIKSLLGVLAALFAYLLFKVFLPNL